ncbi:coactosin-like protein [Stylophora pistillata]|uniref:coactosin-like protein n=1 Tax=Stylophora pistillata TaxID=50429 RepID=UPI000C054AEF|nr:coactosin-like protein [Stylophora pistillata]
MALTVITSSNQDKKYNDNRAYGYVRFETGDEMSRRAKFAFITWIGPGVRPLKKAKVSTDKSFVKKIFHQFGKEILADEKGELRYDKILKILEAANGAEYGKRRYVGTLRTALTDVARIRVLKRQLVH